MRKYFPHKYLDPFDNIHLSESVHSAPNLHDHILHLGALEALEVDLVQFSLVDYGVGNPNNTLKAIFWDVKTPYFPSDT